MILPVLLAIVNEYGASMQCRRRPLLASSRSFTKWERICTYSRNVLQFCDLAEPAGFAIGRQVTTGGSRGRLGGGYVCNLCLFCLLDRVVGGIGWKFNQAGAFQSP